MRNILILFLLFSYLNYADLDPKSKEWKKLSSTYYKQWNSLHPNAQIGLIDQVIAANNVPATKVAVSILLDEKAHSEVTRHIQRNFNKISNKKALKWLGEEAIVKGKLKKKERMRLIRALSTYEKSNEESKKIVEESLMKKVNTGKDEEKVVAIEALGLMRSKLSVPTLVQQLDGQKKNWSMTAATIEALGKIRDPRAVEPLIDCLEIFVGRLQYDAERALEEITYQELGKNPKIWRSWYSRNKGKPFVRPQHKAMTSKVKKDATFYGIPIRSMRIIFICDVSISMGDPVVIPPQKAPKFIVTGDNRRIPVDGTDWLDTSKIKTKLDFMKANIIYTLSQLKPDVYFTLISFHSKPKAWKKALVPASPKNIASAIAEVKKWTHLNKAIKTRTDKRDASNPKYKYGHRLGNESEGPVAHTNTNVYDSVEMAYKIAEKNDANTFYLLTDGVADCGKYVSTAKGIMYRKIMELNMGKKVTFHTIGMGSEHDYKFLRALSTSTNGFYRKN